MIAVKLSVDNLRAKLGAYKDQAPFAMSLAINTTMAQMRKDQVKELPKYLDKSNKFTLSSPRVQYSTKKNLVATLYYDMTTHAYMKTVLDGGLVKAKKERLVSPVSQESKTKAGRLKAYNKGSKKTSYIGKMLSKTKYKKNQFFVGIPKNWGGGDNYLGLWERTAWVKAKRARGDRRSKVWKSTKLKLHVSMSKKSRTDDKKFPYKVVAAQSFQDNFYGKLVSSFHRSIKNRK